MSKWPIAVYYRNRQRCELDDKALATAAPIPAERARIRALELWDHTEEYRLAPRFRDQAPHFYSPRSGSRELRSRYESSTRHNNRRDAIFEKLQLHRWNVGYYAWDQKASDDRQKEKVFDAMFISEDYTWDREVRRTLTSDIRWIHDVFGARLSLRTSERFPWLAVEVIDSHFPDQQAINGWIEASRLFPYIIAFDLVAKPNYLLQFIDDKGWLRISYYVYDGKIWNGAEPWRSASAGLFKEQLTDILHR